MNLKVCLLRFGYRVLSLLASVVLFPFFLLHPRGRARIFERYGAWHLNCAGYEVVWLHGASFGEVRGLIPIIKALRLNHPQYKILVSATSVTGLEVVKDLADWTKLLPFDHPFWIKRALKDLKPKVFILGETELWPEILPFLKRRGTKLALVNARISDYSFPHYRRFRALIEPVLRLLDSILVSDIVSVQRLIELGAEASVVKVSGNTKYDSTPKIKSKDEGQAFLRELFFQELPTLVLGSIRPGEEDYWLPCLERLKAKGFAFNCLLAPRHQEKFEYFAAKLSSLGISFVRRSGKKPAPPGAFMLLDSLGELERAYAGSDLAFIGATLVNIGGHNPLEAAQYGVPVVLGPYYNNVRGVVQGLKEKKACCIVHNQAEIDGLLETWRERSAELKYMGQRAKEVWAANCGAVKRIMEQVDCYL